jgi:mono/diheme cytochrome c family protein
MACGWTQSSPTQSYDDLREHGKKVFAGRCAKCHDEDASKKLPDGSTLLTRLAASKDPKALLATRLKSMPEQDSRGVAAYMDELMARFRSAQATANPR